MTKNPPNNVVGWFEIPTSNMERAMKFYETVFEISMERHMMGPLDMAWFPSIPEGKGTAGALVYHADWYKPSTNGVLVYFTAYSGDVEVELKRAEKAGGKILQGKKAIGEYGFVAFFLDSEGNRIGLHAGK